MDRQSRQAFCAKVLTTSRVWCGDDGAVLLGESVVNGVKNIIFLFKLREKQGG